MNRELTVAPTAELIDLAEAKTHLRVDHSDEDSLINTIIAAATEQVEHLTNRAYSVRTYRMDLSGFASEVYLPAVPLSSISSVKYYDDDNTEQTISSANYSFSGSNAVLYFNTGFSFPTVYSRFDAVQITYVSGYATAPDAAIAACKLIVGDMYENREAGVVGLMINSNSTVDLLLATLKVNPGQS